MNKLCEAMLTGAQPSFTVLRETWAALFPLFEELQSTPQDAEWHGEGNVAVHTEMVLHAVRNEIAASPELSAQERLVLQLAAFFHYIGKPLTTKTKVIEGRERIVSPQHAAVGRNYLCLRLAALQLPYELEEQVLACVALHHHPRRLVQDDAREALWRQLARECPPHLLYHLERADLRGRLCPDLPEQLEIIDMFRLRCEELGLWHGGDAWGEWHAAIADAFANRSAEFIHFAQRCARRDAEAGLIQSVEEAIARSYGLRDPVPVLTVLWGPSGSGKSHWVEANRGNATVISLDDIREEIGNARSDQTKNGQVLQAAKTRLKAALNPKQPQNAIWDATNIRRDFRAPALQLGFDYGMLVRLVCLRTPLAQLQQRNKKRPHPVPESVLQRQIQTLEWPGLDEAHEVLIHY
jgi:predicted kinase